MANFNFQNVAADKALIGPKLLLLRQKWDERKALWATLPRAKKIALYKNDKLPFVAFMVTICKYVKENYPDVWELIDD